MLTATTSYTLACDFVGCATPSFTGSLEDAEKAGWTYSVLSYGVNSGATPTLRCPTHKGQ